MYKVYMIVVLDLCWFQLNKNNKSAVKMYYCIIFYITVIRMGKNCHENNVTIQKY